jgi:hypothetical protein
MAPAANKSTSSAQVTLPKDAVTLPKSTANSQAIQTKVPPASKKDIPSAAPTPSEAEQSKFVPKVEINEKEIDIDSEKGKPEVGTVQHAQGPGFVQILVWLITTCFPLLFLGMSSSLLRMQWLGLELIILAW